MKRKYEYWTQEGRFGNESLGHILLKEVLHRTDGPALIIDDGSQRWYLWDEEFTQLGHFNKSPYFQNLPPEQQVLERLKIR